MGEIAEILEENTVKGGFEPYDDILERRDDDTETDQGGESL